MILVPFPFLRSIFGNSSLVSDLRLLLQVRLMEKRVNHPEWSQNSSNEGVNYSPTNDGPGGEPPLQGNQGIIIKQLECEVEQQVREQPCPSHSILQPCQRGRALKEWLRALPILIRVLRYKKLFQVIIIPTSAWSQLEPSHSLDARLVICCCSDSYGCRTRSRWRRRRRASRIG